MDAGPGAAAALDILVHADLKSMGCHSARYIHTVYQKMSMAVADRDFYYGDPAFEPTEPMRGRLPTEYARARYEQMRQDCRDATIRPADPYPFQGGVNPFWPLLDARSVTGAPAG